MVFRNGKASEERNNRENRNADTNEMAMIALCGSCAVGGGSSVLVLDYVCIGLD